LKKRAAKADGRPTPVEGIKAKHAELAEGLGDRADRWSQLLAKAIADEFRGQYLVTRSALSAEEHEELAALTPKAHAELRLELDEAVARLRVLLTTGDPFYILSVIQDMNMMVPWGEYYEPTHQGSEAKVELVAGLLATQPAVATREHPPAVAIQSILDEVDHVVQVVLLFNLSMPPKGGPEVAELRFMTANRWMSVRGSSFAEHGEDLAKEIYRPQNDWMLEHFGFTIDDLIQVGKAVVALTNERRNEAGRAGAEAANAELAAAEGLTDSEAQEAFGRALAALLGAMEGGFREARTVTPELICQHDSTLDIARVSSVLRDLSVSVGSLEPTRYTGLYDENPLRSRPFLEFDGEYLLAIPGAITRDVDRLLEARVLEGSAGFSKQRAKTLDRLATEYLGRLLPGGTVHANLRYEGTELDGLVLFEDIAMVVEGKGSGLSVQGQRGDTKRLGRDIEDAVEDAWRQGARAREYLLRPGDALFYDESNAEVLRVPEGRVRRVVIVNPTLQELGGMAAQLPLLRSLGLFATGEYPWSVYINDLRVIAETSENPAVFLHYIEWRARLPLGDQLTVVDEIDLWASYLLCERFGALHEGAHFIVGNSSTDFDAYYDGLAGRAPVQEPPRKFLPESVRAFVDRLATARPPGWLEATGVCLDLSLVELALLDVELPHAAAAAAGDGPVVQAAGRLVIVGIARGANASEMLFLADPGNTEATFGIAVRHDTSGEPEIAWASYRKPVTFELSEYERQVMSQVTGTAPEGGSSRVPGPRRRGPADPRERS
jgi:hypothetical protein